MRTQHISWVPSSFVYAKDAPLLVNLVDTPFAQPKHDRSVHAEQRPAGIIIGIQYTIYMPCPPYRPAVSLTASIGQKRETVSEAMI